LILTETFKITVVEAVDIKVEISMPIAVIVLNQQGVNIARQIKDVFPDVVTYGLADRVELSDVDLIYNSFGETIRSLFCSGFTIVAVCASGIVIRSIAELLNDKWQEPPVLAIAEDGSAVVPLLGGLQGANAIAREIAAIFNTEAAVTTSGDIRFRTALLAPPSGYILANPEHAKTFLSNLLSGQTVKLEGHAPWLMQSKLPFADDAELTIQVTETGGTPNDRTLVYHLPQLEAASSKSSDKSSGKLFVIGTGPGADQWMSLEVRQVLKQSTDWVGYTTYLNLVEPLRIDQIRHDSENRVELDRARQALDLAAAGRSVVVVSSGDPGIFAMAAAVFEAIDTDDKPEWRSIELQICPGISAMQAAAARIGAPLGHDFCAISLSDILKPWSVIEQRLTAAAQGDFVMAFYNPISTQRRWQLDRTKELLLQFRSGATPVILARSVGRSGESIQVTTLEQLNPEDADMRTLIIVGSSQTRVLAREGHALPWVYTPRCYPVE
jgi:cobalt-precorrin 5A hydrolase / precorrin-3B C17-methyltransferase